LLFSLIGRNASIPNPLQRNASVKNAIRELKGDITIELAKLEKRLRINAQFIAHSPNSMTKLKFIWWGVKATLLICDGSYCGSDCCRNNCEAYQISDSKIAKTDIICSGTF
jgi:hypothetical protein